MLKINFVYDFERKKNRHITLKEQQKDRQHDGIFQVLNLNNRQQKKKKQKTLQINEKLIFLDKQKPGEIVTIIQSAASSILLLYLAFLE